MVKTRGLQELWLFTAIILIGALLMPLGLVSHDEAIYYLGARAVAEHGGLAIENGFYQFHSEALRLRLLIDGPQGLTPQYPAGSALLAGLFVQWLGPRAFILLNALAAVAMLFTARTICLSHFNNETVARIAIGLLVAGTFWVEYALGVWPHTLAAYFVVQAYWFAQRHMKAADDEYRYALLSGVFAGAGILFRLDAVFAVPAIGLIFILFARRFLRSTLLFGVGVLPALAVSSWLNYLKFGSPNPLSYGSSGGNTDIMAYGPHFVLLCIGAGMLVLFRNAQWRINRKVAIAAILVVGGLLFAIPATHAWLLRFWNGFVALVIDIRNVDDRRAGIQLGPADTITFWGLFKKALGQSMPWLGIAAILLSSPIRKEVRAEMAMLATFIVTMTAPFILLTWHGGGGSNMRYFLPVLPALCILCAKLVYDLWKQTPDALIFVAAGLWAAIGTGVLWFFFHESGYAGVQQILSTYFLLATAAAAIAAGFTWAFQPAARKLTIGLFAAGVLMSTIFAVSDLSTAARRRSHAYAISQAVAELPGKSLIVSFPSWTVLQIPGKESILAERDTESKQIDRQLVLNALNAGYRVFLTNFEFDAARDVQAGLEAVPTSYSYPGGRIIELRRSVATRSLEGAPSARRSGPAA